MDLNRLSTGEKTLAGSAALLFILSFFGFWAKIEVNSSLGGATQSYSAWDAYGFLVKLGLFLALVCVALVLARAAAVKMDIPWSMVYLGLAGATLLFMVLALLIGPDESGSGEAFGVSVEISRGIGLFIGTLLAAAMAAGAWMHHNTAPDTTATTSTTPPPAPEGPPPV